MRQEKEDPAIPESLFKIKDGPKNDSVQRLKSLEDVTPQIESDRADPARLLRFITRELPNDLMDRAQGDAAAT